MPRRKPASSKQRKAELQLKRAIKRGDIPQPPQPKHPRNKKAHRNPLDGTPGAKASEPSSKRLQSAFLKVEPELLQKSKSIASTMPLPRPLSVGTAVLNEDVIGLFGDATLLKCPTRPKWRFDMSKKEVEANEGATFRKWTADVDAFIKTWCTCPQPQDENEQGASFSFPRSPTYYERNLEVWRQLWRVSEVSQIILLLLDSRCPALHFPPSLHSFLTSLHPVRPVILVLTKSDLVPVSFIIAWSRWLRDRYPSMGIVTVQSYREQEEEQERKGQGQRKKFYPEMKQDDLNNLVRALKAAHAELLVPPEKVRNDEAKLEKWKPNVRRFVDWDAALRGGHVHVDQPVEDEAEEYITIGLIGQPNVGKSSLLNALFGTHKVKASRTPGKTKHFQTLFWTPHIRLVDCPGLVLPNFVAMELQVLCGILPISQIPLIPGCICYASCLLPLEEILCLMHPSHTNDIPEDKRTWRETKPVQEVTEQKGQIWTAMDILTAYALQKGWVTAKAGRPDTNRAGNALLRMLAEGKIRWAFLPPGVSTTSDYAKQQEGKGIWLGDTLNDTAEGHDGSDAESSEGDITDDDMLEDGSSESEEDATDPDGVDLVGVSCFAALTMDDEGEYGESGDQTRRFECII